MSARVALEDLKSYANKGRADDLARFFKAYPGGYGEGDIFLGGSVPQTRTVAKKHQNLELREVEKLFNSTFHEARLCAAIIPPPRRRQPVGPKVRERLERGTPTTTRTCPTIRTIWLTAQPWARQQLRPRTTSQQPTQQ